MTDLPDKLMEAGGGSRELDCSPVEHDGHPDCQSPDCNLYPHYGVAPHICYYKRGDDFKIGQSIGLPASEWPANFEPDLEEGETAETVSYPNACGTYYCPECVANGRVILRALSPKERG